MTFSIPSREQLARTLFWTLWCIMVSFSAYGLCIEFLGVGLFLPNDPAPKIHMRGEPVMAGVVGSGAAIGLFFVTIWIGRWSMPLRRLGMAALLFFIVCLSIPYY